MVLPESFKMINRSVLFWRGNIECLFQWDISWMIQKTRQKSTERLNQMRNSKIAITTKIWFIYIYIYIYIYNTDRFYYIQFKCINTLTIVFGPYESLSQKETVNFIGKMVINISWPKNLIWFTTKNPPQVVL